MMTRRIFLALPAIAAAAAPSAKPLRGIFIIMATPFTEAKEVDYEDLAREVDFLARCRVHGMVWPQLASEYAALTKDERMRGMQAIAKAARGRSPALVLGVQGPDVKTAIQYLEQAEQLDPDALIAIPPSGETTLEGSRQYYRTLAGATRRPFFIQTTGGAKSVEPTIEFLVEMANEFPNCGYVKEEYAPVMARMTALSRRRPPIKSVFSGRGGKNMLYEMRMGMDGTMPGAPYADIYVQIWELYQSGRQDQARDLFAKLMVMLNLEEELPGTRQYILRKRGVTKTMVSRQRRFTLSAEDQREIDFGWEGLRRYLKA